MTHTDVKHCPLCASCNITMIEDVGKQSLNMLYAKDFGVKDAVKHSLKYVRCSDCGLYFFDPMETGDEELYEHLQRYDWYYMSEKWEYSQSMKYIHPGNNVLEVGAGRAAFSKHVGSDRYTGLEFNQRAIDRARSEGVELLKETVEQHAANNRLYDIVVSFQVLEHVSKPYEFLSGCLGCLKPGGTLIIAVPSMDGFIGNVVNGALNMPPHHVTHWSSDTLKKLETIFNIHLIEIKQEPITDYHYEWSKQVVLESKIRDLLGIKQRLLDLSWYSKIIRKLAAVSAKYIPVDLSGYMGHTIVAAYKKISL